MKRLFYFVIVIIYTSALAQEPPAFQSQFPLKWKTKIGGTSFKTNFLLHDGLLIVGSNGEHFRDWALDKDNGVYFINPANGKIMQHIADEGYGDMDVNGVAAYGKYIFFGNDNEEFLCYDNSGKQIWRMPVSGDVESEPELVDLNCDGRKEIVLATEAGEVVALDSRNGKAIWSFKIKDFTGWKKTDSRFLFKMGAYFSTGYGFVAKPAVTDLNHDGIPDFIYNCRDNYTYAIDGENGNMLWKFDHGEIYYIANAPLVVEEANQKNIYLLQYRPNEDWKKADTYMVRLNDKGVLKESYPGTWHYSINYSPVYNNEKLLSVYSDTMVVVDLQTDQLKKINLNYESYGKQIDYSYYNYYHTITAQPQFFDILKTGAAQLLLLDEYGTMQVLDGNNYKRLKSYSLPAGTETTPLIADMDDDGKMEMLVGCYDGYLYCFDLKQSANGSIASLK